MLLGRDAESAELLGRIETARTGESSVVVVQGEPGMSALLQDLRDRAGDAVVVDTTGAEGEAELPHVHLTDLLRPLRLR